MAEVIINGPEGRIEGRYHHSEQQNAPVALVLHPHPKHGGTMNNKVAYNIFHVFARSGFSVLRFNFRGVGRSEGVYDNGVGELADAATALDWLQIQNPDAPSFWIGGFSFGAWLSMQLLMRRPELEGFIAISPPANMYDFSFLAPCPRSGMIIQGTMDSIVPEDSVQNLVNKLNNQKGISIDYRKMDGADHFYRNKLDDLNSHLHEYVSAQAQILKDRGRVWPDRKRRQLPKSS
jgi:uncharacterized protein